MIEIARNHSARMPQDWYQGRINVRFSEGDCDFPKPYCIEYLIIPETSISFTTYVSLDSIIDIGFDSLERDPKIIAQAKLAAQTSHGAKLGDHGVVYVPYFYLHRSLWLLSAQTETVTTLGSIYHQHTAAACRFARLEKDCELILDLIANDYKKQCQPAPCSTPETNA